MYLCTHCATFETNRGLHHEVGPVRMFVKIKVEKACSIAIKFHLQNDEVDYFQKLNLSTNVSLIRQSAKHYFTEWIHILAGFCRPLAEHYATFYIETSTTSFKFPVCSKRWVKEHHFRCRSVATFCFKHDYIGGGGFKRVHPARIFAANQFQAVFQKVLQNLMLGFPRGLAPTCTENPYPRQ